MDGHERRGGAAGPALARWTAAAAGAVATLGLAVLAGWIFGVPALQAFPPGLTNPMVAPTAIGLMLIGAALWLLGHPGRSHGSRVSGAVFAAMATALGTLKLAEYAAGVDVGIDRILLTDPNHPFPGQMAIPTAVCFVLGGASLLTLDIETRRGHRPAQSLALVAGLVAILSLVGRAYGVPTLSRFVSGTVVMALPTAVAFLLLSTGILTARPDRGVMAVLTGHTPGGRLARRLLPATAAVLLVGGWLRLAGQRAGLFQTELGVAGMAVFSLVVLSVLIWGSARSLDRAAAAREWAQAEVARREEALQESERRQRAILASIGDAVVTTDRHGNLLSINPAMERLAGWSEEEVRGRPYSEVYVLLDRGRPIPPERRFLARAVASRSTVVTRGFDVSLVARDGRHIPVAVTAAPILDHRGRLIGGVDVIRDVSDQREVDRLKSSLVSTVSHELRTPLTMIQGFAELMLARDLAKEERTEAAGRIHAASRRLGRLIDNLLSVSRMESGRIQAHREPLDLADVVGDVASSFRPGDRIRVSVAEGLPRVYGDRDMLTQILTNLLSNGLKYSPDGHAVSVEVRDDGDMVEISVIDRGIGMTPEELSQLFDKFFRSDRPEVRGVPGSGLGLFITKRLVELQGGRIEVQSAPGIGTSVRVALPVAAARSRSRSESGGSRPAPAGSRTGGGAP